MPTCSAYRLQYVSGACHSRVERLGGSRKVGYGERGVLVEVLGLEEALEQVPAHGGCLIGMSPLNRRGYLVVISGGPMDSNGR